MGINFREDNNKIVTKKQLDILKTPDIYESLDIYSESIKPILDRISYVNQIQDSFKLSIIPGIAIKKLNYENSKEIIDFINTDGLYVSLMRRSLDEFNWNTKILFLI